MDQPGIRFTYHEIMIVLHCTFSNLKKIWIRLFKNEITSAFPNEPNSGRDQEIEAIELPFHLGSIQSPEAIYDHIN